MKKILIFCVTVLICLISTLSVNAEQTDIKIKNKLFSISLPAEFRNIFSSEVKKDCISIYHKDSQKAGFGGFVFGIRAYKNPADHAILPGGRKIGELTDKRNNLYDIVLKYPTDVQYDYTKSANPPYSYKKMYEYGEKVLISGHDNTFYHKNQGIKGEDLYKDVLKKHINAINEKWDSIKLENENMSYMYNIIPKNKIGYAYYDVNADGIEELLIGEIAEKAWKGVIYDIYTMVDREPRHVISGGSRNRYYICDDAFICNEYSSGANESGVRVYNLVENSTELFPQVSFKYDGYENSKNPYFISYSDNEWENVTEQLFKERKKIFEKYERFNFTPLNKNSSGIKMLRDRYNHEKDYFDYSVVLTEFPKDYCYTTVKINHSKERILIITDKINADKTANHGLFYYLAKNGFVYPIGYSESEKPFAQSKNFLYLSDKNGFIKFYISDKDLSFIKLKCTKPDKKTTGIKFETIESADKFAGDYGEPAGDDVVKTAVEGFYFEYHKSDYKKKYIKNLMKECINDGVKTQVQMYCCMVKKLHP